MPSLGRPVVAAIRDLNAALAEAGAEGVLIGGVAVSLLSIPRFTADVDALVIFDTAHAGDLVRALEQHGFRPRFGGMAELAKQARLVAVVHAMTGVVVDIALGCMPFEEEVQRRATTYETAELSVRLPTPEDLIILKAIAGRPKDREDIRTIAAIHPDLDRSRVRHWVEQYAELLETPDLWREIEPLLAGK